MRKFAVVHVEAEFGFGVDIGGGIDEPEFGLRIDKAANEPCGTDAVHLDANARDPDATRVQRSRLTHIDRVPFPLREDRLDLGARRMLKEVDFFDCFKTMDEFRIVEFARAGQQLLIVSVSELLKRSS